MNNYNVNNLDLTINGVQHDLNGIEEIEMVGFRYGQHYLYLKSASLNSEGKLIICAKTEICLCSKESKELFESKFNS